MTTDKIILKNGIILNYYHVSLKITTDYEVTQTFSLQGKKIGVSIYYFRDTIESRVRPMWMIDTFDWLTTGLWCRRPAVEFLMGWLSILKTILIHFGSRFPLDSVGGSCLKKIHWLRVLESLGPQVSVATRLLFTRCILKWEIS